MLTTPCTQSDLPVCWVFCAWHALFLALGGCRAAHSFWKVNWAPWWKVYLITHEGKTRPLPNCLKFFGFIFYISKAANFYCVPFFFPCSIRNGAAEDKPSCHVGRWDHLAGQFWAQPHGRVWDQWGWQHPVSRTLEAHQDSPFTLWGREGNGWWVFLFKLTRLVWILRYHMSRQSCEDIRNDTEL